ncbi:MAG: YrhK family protein [Rhodosalinus sp.]
MRREVARAFVDFAAARCVTVGSVLFFWYSSGTAAIRIMTVGPVCFMAKPTIRAVRELHEPAIGDAADLAQRLSGA